jgi:hypothetical protein
MYKKSFIVRHGQHGPPHIQTFQTSFYIFNCFSTPNIAVVQPISNAASMLPHQPLMMNPQPNFYHHVPHIIHHSNLPMNRFSHPQPLHQELMPMNRHSEPMDIGHPMDSSMHSNDYPSGT